MQHALPAGTDLLALHRLAPSRYAMLLESNATRVPGSLHGRYDLLLACDADGDADALQLRADGALVDAKGAHVEGRFLDALDVAWRRARAAAGMPPSAGIPMGSDDAPAMQPGSLPFRGGWALFLGYELAAQVEPVLRLPPAPGAMPIALALRCRGAIIRDHDTGTCTAVVEPGHAALLQDMLGDVLAVQRAASAPARNAPASPGHEPASRQPTWTPPVAIHEDDPSAFTAGVARILDYLGAGDAFQVNLSRGWIAEFDAPVDPAALLERLRAANPAPFSGLLAGNGWAITSASPERLVSVAGRCVQTRPIAGTHARFAGDDDAARIAAMVGHPKERAEHVMLVDLERNDLGRVCTPGSVQVDELMGVESYAHVHHIVSNVRGALRADATPGQVIAAVFPGGTITGCPKVRCMQLIAQLEGVGRGAYTGAMGWLGHDGDMDLNILIRSAQVEGSTVRFRTGAGVVADSDPRRELDETRAKARGMLRALGLPG